MDRQRRCCCHCLLFACLLSSKRIRSVNFRRSTSFLVNRSAIPAFAVDRLAVFSAAHMNFHSMSIAFAAYTPKIMIAWYSSPKPPRPSISHSLTYLSLYVHNLVSKVRYF